MSGDNSALKLFHASENEMQEPALIRYVAMGMLIFLSLCGIIGNALVLYVYTRQKQKLSSTIFILTLAGTDLITSLVTMPFTVFVELRNFHVKYDALCKIFQLLTTTTVPFSASVMVAIAVDRYLCIVHPFKNTMTLKRAKILVVILAVSAACVGMPNSLMYGVYANEAFSPELIDSHFYMNSMVPTSEHNASVKSPISMTNLYSRNETNSQTNVSSSVIIDAKKTIYNMRNTGKCHKNFLIVDVAFSYVYQKVYSSYFAVCAIIVVVLYAIIYRSVLMRRQRRLPVHRQSACCGLLSQGDSVENNANEQTEFTLLNVAKDKSPSSARGSNDYKDESLKKETTEQGEPNNTSGKPDASIADKDGLARPSGISKAKMEKLRLANIKTALMLSIVAVTYITAFLPAWLMALRAIPMNSIVFHMYFVYHVANPIIYAFLNQSFRIQLQSLYKC